MKILSALLLLILGGIISRMYFANTDHPNCPNTQVHSTTVENQLPKPVKFNL
ncbi:MAG: hypothetical protein ACOYN2_02880 [Patescibacteria group bacterium]